jgi:2',3'-cyclic-nucleotide 2'-phosphodiesterase (5'-nucleotidase family)
LFAGDLVQGTPVSTIFHGLPVYEVANLFGFDAATLGNHEFDYGWMQVRKFIQTANYPMVTATWWAPTASCSPSRTSSSLSTSCAWR